MKKHPAFAQAHDILRNGGEIPTRTTNMLLAGMLSEVHQVAVEGLEISQHNAGKLDEMIKSPSLLYLFRNETGKVMAVLGALIGAGFTGWVLLHNLLHIPEVEIWLLRILELPTP